jgi:DNA polymerase (family 10)
MFRRNLELAHALDRLGLYLEIDGADKFRCRAYHRAARSVGAATYDVVERVLDLGDPGSLPGVGPRIGALIREFAAAGRLSRLDELEARYPEGLLELRRVPRLNPRRIRLLHERLGVRNLDDLRRAASEGRLAGLRGLGSRVEHEVLHGLGQHGAEIPFRRADLLRGLPGLLDHVRSWPGVRAVDVAGALRRRRDLVDSVDLVLTFEAGTPLPDELPALAGGAALLERDDGHVALRLTTGLRVNLLAADERTRGSALVLFTGSAAHLEELRRRRPELPERAATEAEFYGSLGLPFIEPELRESRGELDAAAEGRLPTLIRLEDLQGDLHSHTEATDGTEPLERMAEAAAERGLRYLAITDHTKSLKITNGQDERRLREQMDAIDRLNGKRLGITLLKGAEVDILEDGSLDLDDAVLRDLDLTVCSVHSKFTLDPRRQTERVLRAMEHPSFRILGHPTGRLLLRRVGHPLDVERLIHAAKQLGRILELNSQPDRLDLDDVACRRAKDAGVLVSISSDAHGIPELDYLRWGVDQARRGWLEPRDVVNSRPLPELLRLLGKKG